MGLIEDDLSPTTILPYGFIRNPVILESMIKLVVAIGEHPQVSTVVIEFLIVDYPSAFNGMIGRLVLKVLKVVTSIYHLTRKFPTAEGSG